MFVIMAKAPRSRAGTTRNTATNPNQISRIRDEDTLNLDSILRAPPLRVPRTTSPNDQRQARRNFTVADPEWDLRRDFRNELESEEYQEDELGEMEMEMINPNSSEPFFDTQIQNSNSNDDDIFTENSSEEEEEEADEDTSARRRERRKKEKKRREAERAPRR